MEINEKNNRKTIQELLDDAKKFPDYWAAKTTMDFAMGLDHLMKEKNISKADLARNIGTTPAYITKVMRGNENFTVETMWKLALGVGGQIILSVVDANSITPYYYGANSGFGVTQLNPLIFSQGGENFTLNQPVAVIPLNEVTQEYLRSQNLPLANAA